MQRARERVEETMMHDALVAVSEFADPSIRAAYTEYLLRPQYSEQRRASVFNTLGPP